MASLPTPSGSDGIYGDQLNEYLLISHAADGKIKDGAVQTTSAAPTVDAGVANKKYVDDKTDGSGGTANDSGSDAMLGSHAYLAQTAGFVTAWTESTAGSISGFVGATNNPAGTGLQVAKAGFLGNVTASPFISFFVPDGKFFEIVRSTGTGTITWTPFVFGGGNPIDQD